ncbi:MAG: single-stranded DNA-binding protein [Opitutales bacterium]
MATLNKVFLIGNLTRDPELRVTPKGTSICSFGLAVNRQYRDDSGTVHEDTTFVDIDAWGRQGELCSKYLTKGSLTMVEGRLKLDQWESKTGEKRNKIKVVLENVQFLGGRGGTEGGGDESSGGKRGYEDSSPPQRQQRQSEPKAEADLEDDVPF